MPEFLAELLNQNDIFTAPTIMEYWGGLVTTVQLVFLSLILGLLVAVPLAIMRTSKNPLINGPVWFYTYIFRGTPLLIQLYIIYYGLAQIEGIQQTFWWDTFREAFYPALLAFTLNTAAYTTEIIRGAIVATPSGEIEAAKAYGMSWALRMRRIILPSAARRGVQAYSNYFIFMLHAISISIVVTLFYLTVSARNIYSLFYSPFDSFFFFSLLFFVFSLFLFLLSFPSILIPISFSFFFFF